MTEEFKEYFDEAFEEFIIRRTPFKLAISHAIIEIGLIYDELLHECDELVEKPDPSLSKDEAIAQIAALFNKYKDVYETMFCEYPVSEFGKAWNDEVIPEYIKDFGEPYKEYLDKYAP